MMNIKAVVFSAMAVLGTAGLLWTGYSGASNTSDVENEVQVSAEEHEWYGHGHEEVRSMYQRGDILSLEEVLKSARGHHNGRVLETELEQVQGRPVYEVEVLDDGGQVWEMKFDARTGELIREEQED